MNKKDSSVSNNLLLFISIAFSTSISYIILSHKLMKDTKLETSRIIIGLEVSKLIAKVIFAK